MAAKTWDGGGGDENWSTGANWNGDTVPATTDSITFDGTSGKNCTIDALGTWSGGTFTVAGTYTGTITQNVNMTTAAFVHGGASGSSLYTMSANLTTTTFLVQNGALFTITTGAFQSTTFAVSAGTLNLSSATSMLCTGNVSMSGTTPTGPAGVDITAPSGTWEMRANFTCTYSLVDPTYLDFDPNGGTITFTGASSTTIDVPSFVIGFSYNLVTINKTAQDVTVSVSNIVPLGASPSSVVRTLTVTGEIVVSGDWTITNAGTGSLIVNGTLSGALDSITLPCNMTVGAAATFTAGVDLTFNGTNAAVTLTSTVITFGTVVVNKTTGTWTLAASTAANFGTNPTSNVGSGQMFINGTLTAVGNWTHNSTNGVVGLQIGAAGVVTGALTDYTFTNTLTLTAGGAFPTGVALHLDADTATTITMAGITFANSTLTAGGNFSVTIAASTSIPLVSGATINLGTGTLTVNGTLTGNGPVALTGSFTTGASSSVAGTFVLTITSGAFTMNATGTVANTVGIVMNFTTATGRTFAGGGKTYASLGRTGAGSGTLTITGTNTFVGAFSDTEGSVAHTIIFPNVTTTVGAFRVNGSSGKLVTLARTGGAGTFTLTTTGTSDINQVHHISVSNSTVDAAPVWYAGATPPSVDGGGNTNWIFTAAPDAAKIRKGAVLV